MVHYPIPPHLSGAFVGMGLKKGKFPLTETIADSILSLPLWPQMSDMATGEVVKIITNKKPKEAPYTNGLKS